MANTFNSDDGSRGFFKTTAVVVPLATGGYIGARELYRAARDNGGSLFSFMKNGKQVFNPVSINSTSANLHAAASGAGSTISDMQRVATGYYHTQTESFFDLAEARKRVHRTFLRMLDEPDKQNLLSNAIQNARSQAMTTAEAAATRIQTVSPQMSRKEMLAALRKTNPYMKRETFLKAVNSNLSRAANIRDTGPSTELLSSSVPFTMTSELSVGSSGWAALEASNPEFAAQQKNNLGQFTKVELISERTAAGMGKPLHVRFTKNFTENSGFISTRSISVPLPDSVTGKVRMGKDFAIEGVARRIHDHDSDLPAHLYIGEHLGGQWSHAEHAQITKDMQRGFLYNSIDPLDNNQNPNIGPESDGFTDVQARLRKDETVRTSAARFKTSDGKDVMFEGLSAEETLAETRHNLARGFHKHGSEGSLTKGVWDTGQSNFLTFGGVFDSSKSFSEVRAMKKDIRLVADPNARGVLRIKAPLLSTATAEITGQDMSAHTIGSRIGGVSSLSATLLGDLPSEVARLEDADVAAKFTDHLVAVGGRTRADADLAWARMKPILATSDHLQAARMFGHLGEGILLSKPGMGGSLLEQQVTHLVTSKTALLDHAFRDGTKLTGSELLGHTVDNMAITGKGDRNYITGVARRGDGWAITVRQQYHAGTGTKWHAATAKGTQFDLGSNEMFDTSLGVLNNLEEVMWDGKSVLNRLGPEVSHMGLTNFTHDKMNPFQVVSGAAADTLQRIETISKVKPTDNFIEKFPMTFLNEEAKRQGLQTIGTDYLEKIAKHHITFTGGQLIEDSTMLRKMSGQALRDRIASLTQLTSEMMERVGANIRANGGYNDSMFKDYRRGAFKLRGGGPILQGALKNPRTALPANSFLDYSVRNNAFVEMHATGHSTIYAPTKTKMTFDMQSNLYANGYHETLKGMQSDLVYPHGDPRQARAMAEHVGRRDFSKPLGGSLTLAQAFPDGADGNMKTAAERLGTAFDSDRADVKGNYSLDLGEGAKDRYIPVLGHDAFRGGTNQYGDEGMFSKSEHERSVKRIATTTGVAQENAVAEHLKTFQQAMYGKKGYLRADAFHQHAATGTLTRISSELKYADGSFNPFEVTMGADMAKNMGAVDGSFASFTRHPVSTMPFVRIRIDDNLTGTKVIGIDGRMTATAHADFDGDTGSVFLHKTPGAQVQAFDQVMSQESLQHNKLRWSTAALGIEDDTRRNTNRSIETFTGKEGRVQKFLDQAASEARVMEARTAGGAVGTYSNIATRMAMQLEQNPFLANMQKEKHIFSDIIWNATRQSIIAAQKKNQEFTIVDARNYENQFNEQLGKGAAGGEKLHETLMRLTDKFEKKKQWIPEMLELGIAKPSGEDSMVKPMTHWLNANKQVVQDFARGHDAHTDKVYEMLTASKYKLGNSAFLDEVARTESVLGSAVPYLQGANRPEHAYQAAQSKVDNFVKEIVGTSNFTERLEAGAKAAQEKFNTFSHDFKNDIHLNKAAKWVGAGVALAAGIGVLSARPSFDRRLSANKVRPEEVGGAQDHIPGEPATGSRAASGPPRRVNAAPTHRVAIVTPVRSAVNIDVQARGENRQDGVEKAKLLAQMTGANTGANANFTVINRNATRLNSLRFKSQLRDSLSR